MGVVFYEAEATRSLLVSVEAHDKALYFAASKSNVKVNHLPRSFYVDGLLRKKLMYLLFGGVE